VENDSIRASGGNTLIDIWVDGKLRALCIMRASIESFLGTDHSRGMSDEDRCEFVRTHLPQVVAAAKERLRNGDPAEETVVIDAGLLGQTGERRTRDRRKGDQHDGVKLPADTLPHGERRRSTERRRPTRKSPVNK
jgi:hypothetical protein